MDFQPVPDSMPLILMAASFALFLVAALMAYVTGRIFDVNKRLGLLGLYATALTGAIAYVVGFVAMNLVAYVKYPNDDYSGLLSARWALSIIMVIAALVSVVMFIGWSSYYDRDERAPQPPTVDPPESATSSAIQPQDGNT